MKYTKAFEKYWTRAEHNVDDVQAKWLKLKEVAFLAWKAGQKDVKYKYDLNGKIYRYFLEIEPLNGSSDFRPSPLR